MIVILASIIFLSFKTSYATVFQNDDWKCVLKCPWGASVSNIGLADIELNRINQIVNDNCWVPTDMILDDVWNIYILDYVNRRIAVFSSANGRFIRSLPFDSEGVTGHLRLDGYGNVYATNYSSKNNTSRVFRFGADGTFSTINSKIVGVHIKKGLILNAEGKELFISSKSLKPGKMAHRFDKERLNSAEKDYYYEHSETEDALIIKTDKIKRYSLNNRAIDSVAEQVKLILPREKKAYFTNCHILNYNEKHIFVLWGYCSSDSIFQEKYILKYAYDGHLIGKKILKKSLGNIYELSSESIFITEDEKIYQIVNETNAMGIYVNEIQ
jgi:hypothetical protein